MEIVTYICDIKDCNNEPISKEKKDIQVIFTTDQNEGRSTTPYLSTQKIHICQKHLDFLLKGNYIYAHGAMGHNTYLLNQNK